MLTIDEIRERVKDRSVKKVARMSGVHFNALYRLVSGKSKPSYETLKKLSEYLEQN